MKQISRIIEFQRAFSFSKCFERTSFINNYFLNIFTRLETRWRSGALEGSSPFSVKRAACVQYLTWEAHGISSYGRRQREPKEDGEANVRMAESKLEKKAGAGSITSFLTCIMKSSFHSLALPEHAWIDLFCIYPILTAEEAYAIDVPLSLTCTQLLHFNWIFSINFKTWLKLSHLINNQPFLDSMFPYRYCFLFSPLWPDLLKAFLCLRFLTFQSPLSSLDSIFITPSKQLFS